MTYIVIIIFYSVISSVLIHCAFGENGWVLKWSDNFSGDKLDTNYWQHANDTYAHGSFINNNTRVLGENLILSVNTIDESVVANDSCKIQSALIKSKYGWTYGKFEINASVENNNAVAFINLSPVNNTYGRLNDRSGYIDILRHNKQFLKYRTEPYSSVGIRYGDDYYEFNYLDWDLVSQLHSGFHVFTFEWHRHQMSWKVDDSTVYYLNMDRTFRKSSEKIRYAGIGEPFDHAFRLILANQFYASIDCDGIDGNFTGSKFVVDYVKYYEWTEMKRISVGKNDTKTSADKTSDQMLNNAIILFSSILVLFIAGAVLLYYNIRKIKKKVETISSSAATKGDDIYDDTDDAKADTENEYSEIELYNYSNNNNYETLQCHRVRGGKQELDDHTYLQIISSE